MGDVVQFPDRTGLKPPALLDPCGREMQLYTLSYILAGRTWSFSIWGYSFEDVEERVASIRRCLRLDGVVVGEIPAR